MAQTDDGALTADAGEIGGDLGEIVGDDGGAAAGGALGDLINPAVGAVGAVVGGNVGGEIGKVVGTDVGEGLAAFTEGELNSLNLEAGAAAPSSGVKSLWTLVQCAWLMMCLAIAW